MFQTIQQNKQTIWFDPELLPQAAAEHFEPEYWQQAGRVTGSATGRGTTWFVQLESAGAALRHYRRGGLFGRLVKDHYWFAGWEQTRCYQELALLSHLREAGVNVPRPVAARAVKRTVCYQADILTEKVPGAQDLVDILQSASLPAQRYFEIGQQIRKMHDAGVNHTDLNIHNILLDSQNAVWIIDFDKCRRQGGADWQQGNLDRLLRSFNKELARRAIRWQPQEWQALMDGYQSSDSK